jgi:hypothetical protein
MELTDVKIDDLKELAEGLVENGFEYNKKLGEAKLRESLEEFLAENPDVLDSSDPDATVVPAGPDDDVPEHKHANPDDANLDDDDLDDDDLEVSDVKIQSIHRGVITCSAGSVDFGDDGIAEVSKEVAAVLLSLQGYKKC